MSVYGYRRVSGESQLDGFGLPIQSDLLTRLAGSEGLTIDRVFTDAGISGAKDTDERPDLDAMIMAAQDEPGCVILLPKLDRLARGLALQETLLSVMWKTGATVLSADAAELHYLRTGDDPDDPTRTLIRQVLGAVAQFERGQIRMRTRAGKRRKVAQDGWAGGVEPYGWREPGEQQLLTDVHRYRTDDGYTWQQTADIMNERGWGKRNGAPWTATELCRTYKRAQDRPAQPSMV